MSRLAEETTVDHAAASEHQNMQAPDCGSHSNTESDRDPNNDEASSKPADAEGSSDEEPAAGEGLSEEVYEVEKILDHDDTEEGIFYLVHWKGFGDEDDSWEPAENLAFATKAIDEYEARRKSKSKKGRKSSTRTPRAKNKSKSQEKEQKKGSASKEHAKPSPPVNSRKRGRQPKASVSEKSESEPEIPSDDDDEYMNKEKSIKKSGPTSTYSGTVTKAALKSYSPTTTKTSRNSSLSSPLQVDTMSAAKKVSSGEFQALQMRQSWLYDSDSDDDSGPEKENEKKIDQHKKNETDLESMTKMEEDKHKKQMEDVQTLEEAQKSNDRKRKAEENSVEKKKKSKREVHETPSNFSEDIGSATSSDRVENGSSTVASGSDVRLQDQPEIFAIARDRDGRVRVLIGVDGVKKVVSLRDAHDANSWGLVQHILKFAHFTDFES
ncbi:hypothetical protein RB195_019730 [Necator americanus]|uniref:Uncharacterized protein n=2 Tax=Necator americanus TaxID=51031 RepID=W2T208_NECAM|nr:hypothetical protein NECAME_12261 [Necator americanus]ETN75609.1 hypothetical protein NECAME_12261 [Necator americanus]